jgi:hypothetical protein
MRAIRTWVFHPALLVEKPVKVYYMLTVNFQARKDNPPRSPA